MSDNVIVIGAGQAAIAFAAKLRERDADCAITIIGDEPALPYQRPPLSKKYLTGELEAERLLLRNADWYEQNEIKCITSRRATAISTNDKTVTLDDGGQLPFDKLMLATGASPRRLPSVAPDVAGDVHILRNMADADRIRDYLEAGKRMLVVGGGYIGLEVAAVAVKKGMTVHVTEMADRILKRVASPATSEIFREIHGHASVAISEGVSLGGLSRSGSGAICADFSDGKQSEHDVVIASIGIVPNDALAREAGLETDNGIAVDEYARTSHPDIHAAGDCASFPYRGGRIRLESVQNAVEQAEAAAINLSGEELKYDPVPWFWSDQYDVKLQIAGLNHGYDRTVQRPGSHDGAQSVWYFEGNRFVAVDAINDPRAYMTGKRLLERNAGLSPEQAADPDFDLKSLMR